MRGASVIAPSTPAREAAASAVRFSVRLIVELQEKDKNVARAQYMSMRRRFK